MVSPCRCGRSRGDAMRLISYEMVKSVEQRTRQEWCGGVGKEAKFCFVSEGWWVCFASCPGSMYVGHAEPELKAGDKIKISLEKVS
jgi:hypothetical protein